MYRGGEVRGRGGGGVLIITKVYYLISPDLIVTLYIIYRSPRCTKPSIPGHPFLVAFTCHASAIRTLKALHAIRARKKKIKSLTRYPAIRSIAD